jgi:hypothetical protein
MLLGLVKNNICFILCEFQNTIKLDVFSYESHEHLKMGTAMIEIIFNIGFIP